MNLDKIKSIPIAQVAAQHLGLSVDKNNKLHCFNASAHKQGDLHPSLSLDISNNRFKCFSCGVSGSVIDLTMGYKGRYFKDAVEDLQKSFFSEDVKEKEYTLETIKTWKLSGKVFDELYDYGNYLKIRFRDHKDRKNKLDIFFTRTFSGRFTKGRKCSPSLYNQRDLHESPNEIVCYVEGETCVNVMNSLGFLATTAGSAVISNNTFTKEMISNFEGREVVIFADNDVPGKKLISDLAGFIHSKVKSIRVADIESPWKKHFNEGMPEKADIQDFVEEYRKTRSIDDLKITIDSMIDTAKPFEVSVRNNGDGNILIKYFEGKRFVPQSLTTEVLEEDSFLYTDRQFYHYNKGYWQIVDSDFVAQIAKNKLEDFSNISRIKEFVNDLKLSTLLNTGHKLNIKTELINLKNGMYNFIERKLLPHDSAYYSSIRINANFDKNAQCPRWMQFLSETISQEDSLILQEFFGYSLIVDNRFEKILIFVGKGSNGKSVTLKILTKIVGNENVSKVSLLALSDRFKTVLLHNKLLNVCSDLTSQTLKNTEVLKLVTSGDPICVERKHQDPFDFLPFCRLIFSCNELPRSLDKSYAFYRRLIIIPYANTFTGKSQDKTLIGKLTGELDGILIWALEGLHRLFKNQSFSESATSNEMIEQYKLDNDNALLFLKEACVIGANYMVDKVKLYEKYKDFCEDNSLRPVSQRRFNKEIKDSNINIYETRNHFSNKRAWKGVGIIDD